MPPSAAVSPGRGGGFGGLAANSPRSPAVPSLPGITVGLSSIANLVWASLHGVGFTPRANQASRWMVGQEREIKEGNAVVPRHIFWLWAFCLFSCRAHACCLMVWASGGGGGCCELTSQEEKLTGQYRKWGRERTWYRLGEISLLYCLLKAQEEEVAFDILCLPGTCCEGLWVQRHLVF